MAFPRVPTLASIPPLAARGLGAIALAVSLAGCGHVSAAAVDLAADEGNATAPAVSPLVTPSTPPVVPTALTSPQAPSCLGLTDCQSTPLLALSGVTKASAGFLWRKRKVAGTVRNPSHQVLSGEVQIRFLKKGEVVETQYKPFSSLPAGTSRSFELTSQEASDDADVTITTGDAPAATPSSAAS